MIYVDSLVTYSNKPHGHYQWCHMWSDTHNIDELHAMADKIGLRRDYFQDHATFPHYDLVPTKRKRAIQNGAQVKKLREFFKEQQNAKK